MDSHRREVQVMIQQWINEHGTHDIPAHLANLAARARVELATLSNPHHRDKQDKGNPTTPTTSKGAREGILTGLRFVPTGIRPFQGSGHGLTLGKERVKQCIEKFGRAVTLSISCLTDVLVIGDCPGEKKILEAAKRSLKIITLDQLNTLILGDLILEDLTPADYPSSVSTVLDAKRIQVQRHPQSSIQHEQANAGTAMDTSTGQEDNAITMGAGHSNG